MIAQRDPELFAAIPEGRQIIDFRNLLTHEYLKVSDRLVWGAIQAELPVLVKHCSQLLGVHLNAPVRTSLRTLGEKPA